MTALAPNEQSIYSGELLLINRDNPLQVKPDYFSKRLVSIHPSFPLILLQAKAAAMLSALITSLNCEDAIVPVSGYRSLEEQTQIYEQSLHDNGFEFTSKYVALPNCSEHQSGLAIDLAANREDIDFIRPDFPYTGIYQTFRQRAARYGFIERYPIGAELITGIAHEPWHFRFVGHPHAELMVQNALTLEEYIDYIKQFPYGDRHFSYNGQYMSAKVSFLEQSQLLSLSSLPNDWLDSSRYDVSGNNQDGFIITEWSSR